VWINLRFKTPSGLYRKVFLFFAKFSGGLLRPSENNAKKKEEYMQETLWGTYVSSDGAMLFVVINIPDQIAQGQTWGVFVLASESPDIEIGSILPTELALNYRRVGYSDFLKIPKAALEITQSCSAT
jgi:hypothetical protein